MKKILFISLLLANGLVAQAQHEYTIEGHVERVKDGTLISLFQEEEGVGSVVALDTDT